MGVSLMEEEQVKCELCESIKAVNAIAAEELRKLEERRKLDEKAIQRAFLMTKREVLDDTLKLLYSEMLGSSLEDNISFGVAFRTCFEGARFIFIGDNHVTLGNIQYCPFCGRKIKQ